MRNKNIVADRGARACREGFSLVELSVALVIIGLLVAGVTAGGTLLRSMKLKSMVSQAKDFKASLVNFSSVYQGLPGDMLNAGQYFNFTSLPEPSAGTCDYSSVKSFNGDGDDKIDTKEESALALLHLTMADMTKRSYCGAWAGSFVPGNNTADSKLDKGAAMQITCCGGTDYSRGITMKNHFDFFSLSPLDSAQKDGVVSPLEASEVDLKLDDGNPDSGFVAAAGKYKAGAYSGAGCYSGEEATAAYLKDETLREDRSACRMLFDFD